MSLCLRVLRLGSASLLLLCLVPEPPGCARGEDAQVAEDERILRKAGLATDAAGLLEFFRGLTPREREQARLADLVADLGANDFRTRERSWRALLAAGPQALPALRQGAKSPDLEMKVRAERCIKRLEAPLHDILPAALRLLQVRRSAGAVKALLAYVPYVVDEGTSEEIHAALVGLAPASGRDREALVEALDGVDTSRRGAAALTLACRGNAADRSKVRALLRDGNAAVVFRAAQGLSAAGDVAAIPALVELVGKGGSVGDRAEDLLLQMAGDSVPPVFLEDSPAAREKCRAAWEHWWRAHGTRLVPAAVEVTACSSRRARAVVFRFLRALFQGDLPPLQQSAATPFNLAGILTLETQEEFDQLFKEVLAGHKKNRGKISFQLLKVTGRDEFVRGATEGERKFLNRLPREEIRVVYFRGRFGDDKLEESAVLVRVIGCRARVIGFGRGQEKGI